MSELTPKQIVAELDKYIIGQDKAKKSVAVALRDRYRRNLLEDEMRAEITPKNILMIGPTGVGKTEIARRMAKLVNAPFIKVEATKFTEVGYVGRDVESIIRDLVEFSVRMVKAEKISRVNEKAFDIAAEKVAEALIPSAHKNNTPKNPFEMLFNYGSNREEESEEEKQKEDNLADNRYYVMQKVKNGDLDKQIIEIEIEDSSGHNIEMLSGPGMDQMSINLQDMFGGILPKKIKRRKVTVKEALKLLTQQEAQKLIDMDDVVEEAVKKAEERGIIFIDEIDKIAGKSFSNGPDVSREGVQRDILPIVEGSTVITRYGPVKTDYMLFIAAGAFHVSKVSDLIPELQGRFPVRVELASLSEENFKEILTKPNNALIKQYKALLETEGVNVAFEEDAISELASVAAFMNEQYENIGARRLYTVMEKLFEDISFEAPEMERGSLIITKEYVDKALMYDIKRKDISNYII
ncbi:MAG TPA: ATP-dependent protease ATPase subunit HslU [Bacillota bacterium]|nr:ATP-dependent protease ATPase subunit HslU [Bacillota bacterium]HOR85333.1 ATP-dependent protease ATPase subunit HslU [Bacillota bacterium]HPL54043.1 ATP-dependent protease ATPase subunit HslU [Bacillota bacterium]